MLYADSVRWRSHDLLCVFTIFPAHLIGYTGTDGKAVLQAAGINNTGMSAFRDTSLATLPRISSLTIPFPWPPIMMMEKSPSFMRLRISEAGFP